MECDGTILSMSYEIELYQHDPLALANRWMTLPSDELRRRAFKAAYSLDHDELCSLTFAHITAFGAAGATVSDATLRSYRISIRQFLNYCADHATAPLRATPDTGRLWLRRMESMGRSAATVRVRVAGARAMYRALRWATDTTADPFLDVKPAKDITPPWEKRLPYQHHEIERLLEVATGSLKLLILLCSHGGLRIGEALSLQIGDIHPQDRVLIIRNGKGGKMRRVVLSQTLLLNLHLQGEPNTPLVGLKYQCAIKHLRAACAFAKVTYRGWHSMRHYSGTRLMRETGDLDCVARHLGHADLATARIYAKWSEDSLHSTVGQW